MRDDVQMAAFQAAMLELLDSPLSASELKDRMLAHPASAPFRDWVAQWDLRCVETAGLLVKQWGRRRALAGERAWAGEG